MRADSRDKVTIHFRLASPLVLAIDQLTAFLMSVLFFRPNSLTLGPESCSYLYVSV